MTQANSAQPSIAFDRAGLHPLWRWWLSELKATLPVWMANWLDGDATATNVTVDEDGMTIITTDIGATRSSPPRRVPIDALASSPVLREMIEAGRDRVRLVLTPDQALVKTITLPLATEENLRDVVGFELDRHTPFTPDQAYYDVQIVRRDAQNEKITILLAVASKSEIVALGNTLRQAGLTCTAIGISDAAVGNHASLDLQPIFEKPPRRLSRMHRVNLGLLGIAAILAFIAVILPIWQKREAVRVLIPQAEKAGTEFQISERVHSEYVKLAAEYNFLVGRKHAVYPVLSVIEELAQAFPDTTWVQKLDIKVNGKVREVILLGEAQSASRVIENLEQSPLSLFQNSKQQSQTTRLQANTERFHVSAEIKPRPVPTLEGIEDITAAATPAGIAPAVAPMLSTSDPGATNPSAGLDAGAVVTVVAPTRPASAVVTSTPVPAPSAGKSLPPSPASPGPPLNTYNGPSGPQSPPAIELVPPAVFNLAPAPFSPPPVSYNPLNPPPGPQSPPTIVPIPSSAPPGKRSGS